MHIPCIINRILGLNSIQTCNRWTVMLHLHGFCWAVRNRKQAKIKNENMSLPGIELATPRCQTDALERSATNTCSVPFKTLAENNTRQYKVSNLLLLGVHWNRLSDKVCISYTNVDVIHFCLRNFARIHKTIINLINVLSCIIYMTGF